MNLILFLLLAKHSIWTPKAPPKLPSDTMYIQIHTTRRELDKLKVQCKKDMYVKILYPDNKYIILPCSVVEGK